MPREVEKLKLWVSCKEKSKVVWLLYLIFMYILDTFYVMDAFALPVEATETRVNAGSDANEFMCDHIDACERVVRPENVCGWYHSHPGYGCWLSGIDVGTQMLY